MEHKARQHVVALFIDFILLLLYVKFTEEIEGNYGVDVYDDSEKHDSQDQLFAVVRYWLQNCSQSFETDCNIQQMSGKEEIVEISEDRESKVPQGVQEGIVCDGDASLKFI